MTEKQFTIVREFDAPREAIWQAWTDPTIAAKWWHPNGATTPPESVSIDLREGGSYAYTMVLDSDDSRTPEEYRGKSFPISGTYLAVREPEHLKLTWANPGDAADEQPVLTVDLRELDDDRTEMTFHVLGAGDDRGAADSVHDGWAEAFEKLDAALAGVRS